MSIIGYHASHEQHTPSDLLEYVVAAEAAGFSLAMCSDHFHPWVEAQGQSGFAWSWLGAALQATSLPFGVVNAPGWRYHPAIIAQAAATLAEMYPGRFWISVGSGELLNEGITGDVWPTKADRNARLRESVDVMRALWAGETVTHRGRIRVEEARLYTLPAEPPQIFGAALSPETAEWLGGWADGMITVGRQGAELEAIIEAFRRGGGEGKPMKVQLALSYAATEEAARRGAHEQWRGNVFGSEVLATLRTPAQFEVAARYVSAEEVAKTVRVSSDLDQHAAWVREYIDAGFDEVYLFNVNKDQRRFIEDFGGRVLPALEAAGARR